MNHENYLIAKRYVDQTANELWGSGESTKTTPKRTLWHLILSLVGC